MARIKLSMIPAQDSSTVMNAKLKSNKIKLSWKTLQITAKMNSRTGKN
jgi:hypothetical protein